MQSIKNILKAIGTYLKKGVAAFKSFTLRDGNPMTNEQPPYAYCMNCGTELSGMYCHKCGQYASSPRLEMTQFVKEYIKNILSLDRQALPTLCNLLFHPGHLVKEYCIGRYSSYLHPLKLNFFLLIVLITLFSLFGTDDKIQNSLSDITNQETFIDELILSEIAEDSLYINSVIASKRGTIKVIASNNVVKKHNNIFDMVEVLGMSNDNSTDTMILVTPRLLIEDKILIKNGEYYSISHHISRMDDTFSGIHKISEAWRSLTTIAFSHFPLLMLLSLPFLIIPMRLCFKKRKIHKSYFYILSLYHIAFVALLTIVLYLASLIFDFISPQSMQYPILFILFSYMMVSMKQAFDIKSWFGAAAASVIINIFYFVCSFICISIISLIVLMVALA